MLEQKETRKKFFILEKLEEMINDMKRRVVMAQTRSIGIKKEFLKTKNVCRVTFRLPNAAAPDAKSVYIVGDFNNWNYHANPMKKLKKGDYTIKLDLEPEREYQFRYLIDELKWENDWKADQYVKSPYGDSDNSVVIVRH
ncbi:MAG: isoamylase early set domain-containing protein [Candidatus Scalindua sediminis]